MTKAEGLLVLFINRNSGSQGVTKITCECLQNDSGEDHDIVATRDKCLNVLPDNTVNTE